MQKSAKYAKMVHVVKRKGNLEKFDERKVYASCYFAGLNCHINKLKAEKLCEKVTRDIKLWLRNKKKISSDDIFRQMIKILNKYDEDVSFMYETHRDVN